MITVTDKWLSPPKAVVGNLRFTPGGVYAEFVLRGQPGGMLPFSHKRKIAEGHRPLVRQLPSGMIFSGLLAPIDSRAVIRRMVSGYEDCPAWVAEVRDWEPYLRIEPFYERVFWLAVPVDSGLAGRTEPADWRRRGARWWAATPMTMPAWRAIGTWLVKSQRRSPSGSRPNRPPRARSSGCGGGK